MDKTRREFLQVVTTGAALGVAGSVVVACGGDDDSGAGGRDGESTGSCDATMATIAGNHGHVLMVSAADVEAGSAKPYDIQGSATHTHTVTVSAANFSQLQMGRTITVNSSTTSAHDHSVTVRCA